MKKLSLLLGGIVLSTAVMAQKPEEGVAKMSLEGQIGLTSGPVGGTNLQFNAPAIRFRYFVMDNLAVRATLGLQNDKSVTTLYENPDYTGGTGTVTNMNNMWIGAIGAEYHFPGTDRLSPYAGLDIRFGGGADREEGDNTNNGATFTSGDNYTIETKNSMFGLGLVAGTDFYFAQHFYLGLEVGFRWSSMNDKEGTFNASTGGVSTSGKISGMDKSSEMSTNATALFRLGWRF